MKAKSIAEAKELVDVPNIGPAISADLRLIGVKSPKDLRASNPYALYVALCQKSRSYKDPCVLDVFLAAVHFAKGGRAVPWWRFTPERKKNFWKVEPQVVRFKE